MRSRPNTGLVKQSDPSTYQAATSIDANSDNSLLIHRNLEHIIPCLMSKKTRKINSSLVQKTNSDAGTGVPISNLSIRPSAEMQNNNDAARPSVAYIHMR